MDEPASYEPASHYDRVSPSWGLLLGDELHYGVFERGDEPLEVATRELTDRMARAADVDAGVSVLDVGCGTGGPARHLAVGCNVSVVGISTRVVGVEEARKLSSDAGLDDRTTFEVADGMDNGRADESFDRVLALESSHLMRDRPRLVRECVRVLRPGGRFALCDIMLGREMPFDEVRRLRRPLALLRSVFGDARMEPADRYAAWFAETGLSEVRVDDLTTLTRPTFERWEANAARHEAAVVAGLGQQGFDEFVESCAVLRGFWDDGTLGYALVAATKPSQPPTP